MSQGCLPRHLPNSFLSSIGIKNEVVSNLHSLLLMPVKGVLCTYVEKEFPLV